MGSFSKRLAVTLLAVLAALRCSSMPADVVAVARAADFQAEWRPIFQGIDIAYGRKIGPDPLALCAARIDLKAPGIEFFVTPSNGDKPAETDGMRTSTFLQTHRLQLAVNASPFAPVEQKEGAPKDILGLSASRGDVYSQRHGDHGALLISRDNKATIAAPPFNMTGVYNAVGGFGIIVRGGQLLPSDTALHPRTAAGVSRDGRYLYLLVIDGRQPGYSVGATTGETGEWMLRLGAHDALNLDGGGSTDLVVAGEEGKPKVLNRPINASIPGNERVNGNSLGVYARER